MFIDNALLLGKGARMITPDRPGLGWSGYQVRRRIEDWPADIAVLVDRLGLSRFAVLGFSDGTPYATALAASALPVSALGIVSGDAPPGAVAGLPPGLGTTADRRPRLTAMALRLLALMARLAPDFTANRTTSMLPPVDREIVSDPALRRLCAGMIQDALRQGARGTLLDLQLGQRGWRVLTPSAPIPIHIWHGTADAQSPVAIAHHLATNLPQAELHLAEGEGHVSVFVRRAAEIVHAMATAAPNQPKK